jgi:hypothetical protein
MYLFVQYSTNNLDLYCSGMVPGDLSTSSKLDELVDKFYLLFRQVFQRCLEQYVGRPEIAMTEPMAVHEVHSFDKLKANVLQDVRLYAVYEQLVY